MLKQALLLQNSVPELPRKSECDTLPLKIEESTNKRSNNVYCCCWHMHLFNFYYMSENGLLIIDKVCLSVSPLVKDVNGG